VRAHFERKETTGRTLKECGFSPGHEKAGVTLANSHDQHLSRTTFKTSHRSFFDHGLCDTHCVATVGSHMTQGNAEKKTPSEFVSPPEKIFSLMLVIPTCGESADNLAAPN